MRRRKSTNFCLTNGGQYNICMIAYTNYLSDSRVKKEAEALVQEGYNVDFLALDEKARERNEVINGVNIHRFPFSRYKGKGTKIYILNYIKFFIFSFFWIMRENRRKNYKIFHIDNMPDFFVFIPFLQKLFGARIILDIHDLMPELFSVKFKGKTKVLIKLIELIEKLSCHFADAVITTTEIWKNKLLERTNVKKIYTIMNLPDSIAFSDGKEKKMNGFNIIYHGTLVERYGVDIGIKAIALLKDKIPNLRFYIYGDGDDLDNLRNLCNESDVQDIVYFSNGFIPYEKITEIVPNMDICIVPNRKDRFTNEVFNIKVAQSMAARVPVVASRTYGLSYYFNNSQILFFEPENPKDLADKIYYLYTYPQKRKEIIRNALEFVEKHNWESEKKKYLRIINGLLEK